MNNRNVTALPWIPGRLANWSVLRGTPALENVVSVQYSSRMTRSLGRCYPERRLIRLAKSLLDGPRTTLEEALCHELAHIAVHELNSGKCRPHGPEWKDLMRKAGFEPRTRLRWVGAPPPAKRKRRRRYLYIHRCPVCHTERTARRAVRQRQCAASVEAGLEGTFEIWRLAAYLQRPRAGNQEEGVFICKVSHANKRPILFLPDRKTNPDIPKGWTNALVDGELYEANFVKVAVNVMRRKGIKENSLGNVLRNWFGPNAGLPGTHFHVVLSKSKDTFVMEPYGSK